MFWSHGATSPKQMKLFDKTRESLRDNQYLYKKLFAGNPGVLISLLKTGRTEEAMRFIAAKYNNFSKKYGEKHRRTAEVLAMRAMAYAQMGEKKQAMKDFSNSIPHIIRKKGTFWTRLFKRSTVSDPR